MATRFLQVTKLAASEPISKFQPSASTNSMSLNGNATSTGDSIIMPKDIRMLDTTMSMTRKGMKIMNPIWNADLSSLVTNAGTSTRRGAVSAVTDASSLAKAGKQAQSRTGASA